MNKIEIWRAHVVQYIKALREGGSLPAIVKADDGFLYVLKFRGADAADHYGLSFVLKA